MAEPSSQQQYTALNPPTTLLDRLRQSSHPVALLFFLLFRFGSLISYLFGEVVTRSFILTFIVVILLLAADFWNVKNISGRLLVGLRWWNETAPNGESIWVFESKDPNTYINPIDSKVFWVVLYSTPVFWALMGIVAILSFEFLTLILVIIAIILTSTNAMAFTKCDNFGKANGIASNVFGRLSGGVLSRINPFA